MAKQIKQTRAQLALKAGADKARFELESHMADIQEIYGPKTDEFVLAAIQEEFARGYAAGRKVSLLDVLRVMDESVEVELDRGVLVGLARGKQTLH